MNNLLPTLFLALLCGAIGFALSAAASALKGGASRERTPRENWVEIARFWRDRRAGDIILEVRGKRFRSAVELSAEQKQYLARLVEHTRLWLDLPPAAPPRSPTVPPETARQPAAEAQPPATPADRPGLASPGRPNLNPIDMFSRALKTEASAPAEQKSIAAQVDDILQEMLAHAALAGSSLRSKGIRLLELPGKGLVVMVGLDRFDGVEAVPDPEVRSILKAAVAEWERRAGEGGSRQNAP